MERSNASSRPRDTPRCVQPCRQMPPKRGSGAENPGLGRYSPPRVTEMVPTPINGNPDPQFISTSYVERNNLTMRMQMRRFRRLTNTFSKSLRNLKDALALHFAHYNFAWLHGSLRVTPAMTAGVADRAWNLCELLAK